MSSNTPGDPSPPTVDVPNTAEIVQDQPPHRAGTTRRPHRVRAHCARLTDRLNCEGHAFTAKALAAEVARREREAAQLSPEQHAAIAKLAPTSRSPLRSMIVPEIELAAARRLPTMSWLTEQHRATAAQLRTRPASGQTLRARRARAHGDTQPASRGAGSDQDAPAIAAGDVGVRPSPGTEAKQRIRADPQDLLAPRNQPGRPRQRRAHQATCRARRRVGPNAAPRHRDCRHRRRDDDGGPHPAVQARRAG
jgi:hypothetical protein